MVEQGGWATKEWGSWAETNDIQFITSNAGSCDFMQSKCFVLFKVVP